MKKIILTLVLLFVLLIPQVRADTIKYATVFSPTTGYRKAVVVGDPLAFTGDKESLDGYLLETSYGYILPTPEQLGFTVVSNYKTTLSRSITSTASTIYVSSLSTKDDHTLTMADLGSKVFLTIEPGSNKEEIIMCADIGTLSWTSCTRGLAFYATSTAAVTANQKSHSAGAAIVMSNVHYVYEELVDKDTADTIAGIKTFTSSPIVPNPTTDYQAATKYYVDNVALQGGATSTETVMGLVELGTRTEAARGTWNANRPTVLTTDMASSSLVAEVATVVVTKLNEGHIDQSFIDLTENFTFEGNNTMSGTNTISGFTSATNLLIGSSSMTVYPTASSSIATKGYVDNHAPVSRIYDSSFENLSGASTAEYASTTIATTARPARLVEFTFTIMSIMQTGGNGTYIRTYNILADLINQTAMLKLLYTNNAGNETACSIYTSGTTFDFGFIKNGDYTAMTSGFVATGGTSSTFINYIKNIGNNIVIEYTLNQNANSNQGCIEISDVIIYD